MAVYVDRLLVHKQARLTAEKKTSFIKQWVHRLVQSGNTVDPEILAGIKVGELAVCEQIASRN